MDTVTRDLKGPVPQTIVFKDKEYTIPTNILCGKSISSLRNAIEERRKKKGLELLAVFNRMGISLTNQIMAVLESLISPTLDQADFHDAIYNPELLPSVLHIMVEDLSIVEASELCLEYPLYLELADKVLEASGWRLLKNSTHPPTQEGDSQRTQSEQSNNSTQH